jgi:sec-independent protein translocase protein TatB
VIGPEKIPKTARIPGFWVRKTRNMLASVKAEIKEELQAEEMRQILKEQSGLEEVQHLIEESSETVNKISSSINSLTEEQDRQLDDSKRS